MCGVFGYVSKNGKRPNLERLERIAVTTERRGPHAFGFAWIDSAGRLKMFKSTGRISDHLGLLRMAADARILIGHCRWATQGDPANNLNNHPHASDGGWIVHNGTIPTYERVIADHELQPVTQCDSEVLALLVERLPGSLVDRCIAAALEVEARPLVTLGLWPGRKGGRMIAVRRGNPLRLAEAGAGFYLASLAGGLPDGGREVRDNHALEFDAAGGLKVHPIEPPDVDDEADDADDAVPVGGLFNVKAKRRYGF